MCAAFADHTHRRDDLEHRGSPLQQAISKLRGAGVLTVAPAGNAYEVNSGRNPQGMAWPAILREVVSVGALERREDAFALTSRTQRLQHQPETGCGTTVFVEPGPPGDTSGAAGTLAGWLAREKRRLPRPTMENVLVNLCQAQRGVADPGTGLVWPALPDG